MQDTYRHRGLRQKLVQELREKGIKDERILNAFWEIPRHYFLDKIFAEWAYKDVAFPIDADQTISQPYTVAVQTTLLQVKSSDIILEIGTGSGFQACVLSYIGAKVYTIERQKSLFLKTNYLLERIGYGHIRTLYGDGFKGAPRFAPFDKIIVTAGATDIPTNLLDQLKIGGLMVIPCGEGDDKKMMVVIKQSESSYTTRQYGAFRFVPFLKGVV